MTLLNLPLELVREILYHAVQIRGLKRGLRLRLVNRLFALEIFKILIYKSRLFDARLGRVHTNDIKHAVPAFAAEYLEHRLTSMCEDENETLLGLQRIAQRLSQDTDDGRTTQDYVHELCLLVVKENRTTNQIIWCRNGEWAIQTPQDQDNDLFIAAVYTRTSPIINHWLTDKRELPLTRSTLFGELGKHAIKLGDHRVLAAMMPLQSSVHAWRDIYYNRRELLLAATMFGDLETVEFVYGYRGVEYPWVEVPRGYPEGEGCVFRQSKHVQPRTPRPEIFDFIQNIRRYRGLGLGEELGGLLFDCAYDGYGDTLEHIINMRSCVDAPVGQLLRHAVTTASAKGYGDIVRLLLFRGAVPCPEAVEAAAEARCLPIVQALLHHGTRPRNAVRKAAAMGNWDIVLTLLRHAFVNKIKLRLQPCLVQAVRYENTDMFRLLLAYGARISEEATRKQCEKVAKAEGLESMMEMVEEADRDEREGRSAFVMRYAMEGFADEGEEGECDHPDCI